MFGGSGHKSPTPAPAPVATPTAPTILDPAVQKAAEDARLATAQAAGRLSTILTSGQGDTSKPVTSKKTLLGA